MEPYKGKVNACVHCFTGTGAELRAYVEQGWYIGITGWVCDEKRGKELQKIVSSIPLDRLMIETDAPFLAPWYAVYFSDTFTRFIFRLGVFLPHLGDAASLATCRAFSMP